MKRGGPIGEYLSDQAELVRDAATGVALGMNTFRKTYDWRGSAEGIAGSVFHSDSDHYHDEDVVDDYSESRRQHIDDHWDDLVERARSGELTGKQYITAKEMREVDSHFERQGVDMGAAAPLEGRTVLDVTGGEGWLARYLAGKGAEVVMGDLSRPMVTEAVEKDPDGPLPAYEGGIVNPLESDAPGSVHYYQGDVEHLPIRQDSVDDAFIWRSIHHMGDIIGPLNAVKDAVKSGGRIMFDTFNSRSGRRLYNDVMGMESTMYTSEDVMEAVINVNELFIRNREPRMVMPYGGFRGLDAGDPHLARTVEWNERMEEEHPEYGSVDFWTLHVDGQSRT